jgi:F0F1-type ATP synthase assembly protein I
MHRPAMRLVFIGGWLACIGVLAGWLVDAIHRGHLGGIVIVAVGLAALVVVPVLRSQVNRPPSP